MVFGFRRVKADPVAVVRDDVPAMPATERDRFIFNGKPALGGRPVPFEPKGAALPVFFLHIPRTSGGTVLKYLGKYWGQQAVVQGVEGMLPQLLSRKSETLTTDVVTGHVPLVRWEFFTGSSAYRRVTVLRDPWARLVSHINCIGRYNDGEPIPAGPWEASWRVMADAVARTDFASRTSMERLVRLWSPVEGGFDNLQVRMLLTGSMASMVKALVPRDVERAIQNLETFSVVGLCEDQAGLQRRLGALAGAGKTAPLVAFENAGKPSVLSVRNELAREVLEPWFAADLELYTRAKAIAARQPV